MSVSCQLVVVGGTPVLQVQGDVDMATVGAWRDHLLKAITTHRGGEVLVDLDGVTSLDDTALGVLLGAAGRAREAGGELVVVCTTPRLLQRFATTRLDRAIDVRARLA